MVTDITLVYKCTQTNILLTVHNVCYMLFLSLCSLSLSVSEWDKENDSRTE